MPDRYLGPKISSRVRIVLRGWKRKDELNVRLKTAIQGLGRYRLIPKR